MNNNIITSCYIARISLYYIALLYTIVIGLFSIANWHCRNGNIIYALSNNYKKYESYKFNMNNGYLTPNINMGC